jgi:hypothetical protein
MASGCLRFPSGLAATIDTQRMDVQIVRWKQPMFVGRSIATRKMKAPSIFPFIRVDELRHETIHHQNAPSLSPDSVMRCHGDRSSSAAGNRPVWGFRRRVYVADVPHGNCGGHCVCRIAYKNRSPRRICLSFVPPLRYHRRWTLQHHFGLASLSGAHAGDSSSPVQAQGDRMGESLAAAFSAQLLPVQMLRWASSQFNKAMGLVNDGCSTAG